MLFKAILPYEAEIQRDVRLEHYGLGVVIHPNVTIGSRVKIYHHITLAAETWAARNTDWSLATTFSPGPGRS